ncbi:MAG: ATP-binding cassette domain-containing protein [Muribaculaceae bacterium]|nr:ATP-binding cassette domain-containing protein [Muribaculaceae bacterium]
MSILNIQNINTGYGKKQVLHDVTLEVKTGSALLLVGSNGSGKSTLLKAIYGLLALWGGSIEYEDSLLQSKSFKTPTYRLIQRGLMYVPQKDALFDDMTVEENIRAAMLHQTNKKESRQKVLQVLELMPELNGRKNQLANRLSGGERKLLSLAMVVANEPKLLLYDEPLAGICEENVPMVMHWLQIIREKGTTMLIVEHRIKELINFADTIVGLKLGQLHTENLTTLDSIKSFMI